MPHHKQKKHTKVINDEVIENLENSSNQKDSKKKMQESQSDGSIIKNQKKSKFTQKIVSKVKSWNNREVKESKNTKKNQPECTKRESMQNVIDNELARELEGLTLNNSESEEAIIQPELLKARDSLENILSPKIAELESREFSCSKSIASCSQERPTIISSHMANIKANSSDAISRVLTWDPWDKLSRKSKKEFKRRKSEQVSFPREPTDIMNVRGKSPIIKESCRQTRANFAIVSDDAADDQEESYEYKPFKTKKRKSVEFINQVLVIYYANDEIVAETTEPLKKETEQQIRNKEMRKGHIPATIIDRRRYHQNLMSWF